MELTDPRTPADFRALIAYYGLILYELAPRVGVHPSRLSSALNGRSPFSLELAQRLRRAIAEETRPA